MCIIWPQRLALELNVISCITCPCFKSLVPGSGRKAAPLACLLFFFFCLAVVQLPGLQASSEWNLKGLVKQTVVYISGSIFMSNYRMIFCTGHLVRLPRRCILQLKASTCVFGAREMKKSLLTRQRNGLRAFQTVNNGSLNELLVGIICWHRSSNWWMKGWLCILHNCSTSLYDFDWTMPLSHISPQNVCGSSIYLAHSQHAPTLAVEVLHSNWEKQL